jgi:hypothetical protein
MRVEFTFREIGADVNDADAEIINSAVDFVMDNFFPEFNESEIFTDYNMADIRLKDEIIALEMNPIWLRETMH